MPYVPLSDDAVIALLERCTRVVEEIREVARIEGGDGQAPDAPPFAHWIRVTPNREGCAKIFVGISDEVYVNLGEDCRIESLCPGADGQGCPDELERVLRATIDGGLIETVWIGGRGPWRDRVLASRGTLDIGGDTTTFWGNARPLWFKKARSEVRRYLPYRP